MYAYKFQERIVELIKDSLPMQGLEKVLTPTTLINHRDRYFLVACRNKQNLTKCVFLRYEEWFFYLHGLKSIPDEPNRRQYTNHVRGKTKDLSKLRKKEEKLLEKRLNAAESLIKKIDKQIHRK